MEETDDDHGHVIAADTACLTVGRKTIVHHVFADRVKILLRSNPSSNELYNSLRRLAIPDA